MRFWRRPCYSRPMTARLGNRALDQDRKAGGTFLIEATRVPVAHPVGEDGTVGTGEAAGVHGWPRPTAAMIGIELNDTSLARLGLREVVTGPPIGRDGSVQDW